MEKQARAYVYVIIDIFGLFFTSKIFDFCFVFVFWNTFYYILKPELFFACRFQKKIIFLLHIFKTLVSRQLSTFGPPLVGSVNIFQNITSSICQNITSKRTGQNVAQRN